ncbi:MAG: hypothetical protein ACRDGI_03410, partial [Candidatus Limnocylindrales bacterium]
MSQKRARLRALASLGLSIIVLGALAPATAASSPAEALAPFVVTAGPVSTVTLTPTPDSVARNADPWIDGGGTAQALSGRVIVRSTPSPVAPRITAASRIIHL